MEQLKALDWEINTFVDYMFGPRDSRVRGWFLLDSYLPTFFLTVVYLLSIWLGTKFMKNRPAFSLRGHLIVYNLGVTVLSLYMLIEVSFLKCSTTSEKAKHTYQKRPSRTDMKKVPPVTEIRNGFHKDYFAAANGVLNNKKAQ
nr:elongation of very long chain fatty acids protein 2 [Chrysemys picta bellii]